MKTIILIFSLLIFLNQSALAQQLPNAGFENWNAKTITTPNDFYSFYSTNVSGDRTITKVSDAFHAGSAIKLQTIESGDDTIQGMILIGSSGNQGNNGGLPFSSTPDSISGYVKYNIFPNDTAYFIVAFKKNTSILSQAITIFTGIQTDYKRFCIPTGLVNTNVPDSIVMLISSSRLDPPRKIGSTLTIDSISLINSAEQLPNNSFENWTTQTGPEDPDGWGTAAGQYPSYNLPVLVSKSTDSHSGNFAVKVQSNTGLIPPPFGSGIDGDTIVGQLQLNFINGFSSEYYPFAFRPDSLVGYVKGVVSDNPDNMNLIWVQFFRNSTNIGSCNYQMRNSSTNYFRFSVPVTYNSEFTPDSLQFILFASNPSKYYPGNDFYVDDLSFVYSPTTSFMNIHEQSISVFTSNNFNELNIITNTEGPVTIKVFDANGRVLHEKSISKSHEIIDISDLNNGIYLYRITNNNGSILQNGKFSKR